MDAIRAALGQDRINFFGYSYGTYLGAVYASMYPARVRRMVLDSVVRPSGVWYGANLDQNKSFEGRIRDYFRWMARHNKTYRLGRDWRAVEAAYYAVRATLVVRPVKGRIGPDEFDDVFIADGYSDYAWAAHARALSDMVVRGDAKRMAEIWQPPTWLDQNNYAVYTAVQCRDAAWPRDWSRWHRDNWRLYNAGYRFETWGNAWYNAPCAYWSVPGGPAPVVQGSRALPGMLLVQATGDAATPYAGALEMHRRFPTSRLLVQADGGNHGVSLGGDDCVDSLVAAYLADGSLPADRPGPDATCAAGPAPRPVTAGPAARLGRAG